ncbi:unnamed protein product [Phaedon cochleariae]|uniref:Ataxin-10 n=1 Tax=Phaedon cochleariae TaxID=80249 RepID=A0A9P0DQG1_PHACE|nr:unnamed protein product [Phaedon cochleariae]
MIPKNLFLWTNQFDQPCIDICPEIKLEKCYDMTIPYGDFVPSVKDFFKIQRLDNGQPKRINVTEEVLIFLSYQLKNATTSFQQESSNEETMKILSELFWALRNCSTSPQTQNYIVEKTDISVSVVRLFECVKKQQKFVQIILQFLLNLISANRTTTETIHNRFFYYIKKFISEKIFVYECSALVYNISLFVTLCDIETLEMIFDLNDSEHQNEFMCFYLESCVSKPEFWNIYEGLKVENRLKILEIQNQMQIQNNPHSLPDCGLNILINNFLKSGETVVQAYMEDGLKAHEISLILEILSSISSREEYLSKLQNSKDILINAGVWLINVHRLGKTSDNCFTPVQKLSECDSISGDIGRHPAFGFKADLVRLIGNLCWKNTQLQDLARTAEIIPIILDCCNMDTKNPFIMQWCILAIRNLCENNPDNQKMIAGLHQNGTVSSEILEEMGINLQSDNEGHLKIVSLDSLRQ